MNLYKLIKLIGIGQLSILPTLTIINPITDYNLICVQN